MRRMVLAGALLLAPVMAGAQVQVIANPGDYVLTLAAPVYGTREITLGLTVQNAFAFNPNRFFAITQIAITDPTGRALSGDILGPQTGVYTGRLTPPGGRALSYQADYFRFLFGNRPTGFLGAGVTGSLGGGIGLLGCSVPVIPSVTPAGGYTGLTCPAAGFGGALGLTMRFTYDTDVVPVIPDRFAVQVYGIYVDGPAVMASSAVPEPSTYALMATGLAGLWLVARRRQRA